MDALFRVLNYLAARLREPSTYPGMMLIFTGVAHWSTASQASKEQIMLDIGVAIAGLISVALPDRLSHNSRATDAQQQASTPAPITGGPVPQPVAEEKKP